MLNKFLNKIDYPNLPEYVNTVKLKLEKDVVGVYVSGHPLDKFLHKFNNTNFNSSMIKIDKPVEDEEEEIDYQQASELVDKTPVIFGGIIQDVRKMYTQRDNKEMAIVIVEDLYGSIEVMAVPKVFAKLKYELKPDVLGTFKGKLSVRYGEIPTVMLEEFEQWETETEQKMQNIEPEKPKRLFLKFDMTNQELKTNILEVISNHVGESEVYIRCSVTGQAYKLRDTIKYDNLLEYELLAYIPLQNIKYE